MGYETFAQNYQRISPCNLLASRSSSPCIKGLLPKSPQSQCRSSASLARGRKFLAEHYGRETPSCLYSLRRGHSSCYIAWLWQWQRPEVIYGVLPLWLASSEIFGKQWQQNGVRC